MSETRGPQHFRARKYNRAGDQTADTTTRTVPTPSGLARVLRGSTVHSVEVHYIDGTSVEFSELKG